MLHHRDASTETTQAGECPSVEVEQSQQEQDV